MLKKFSDRFSNLNHIVLVGYGKEPGEENRVKSIKGKCVSFMVDIRSEFVAPDGERRNHKSSIPVYCTTKELVIAAEEIGYSAPVYIEGIIFSSFPRKVLCKKLLVGDKAVEHCETLMGVSAKNTELPKEDAVSEAAGETIHEDYGKE